MDQIRTNGFSALAIVFIVSSFVVTTGDLAPYALLLQLAALLAGCAQIVQRDVLKGTLATAFACMGFNIYLFRRKLDAASGPSACNIDQTFNCDLINNSEYSLLSVGGMEFPITLMGAAFYGGLAFAALGAPSGDKDDGRFHQVNAWFAIVSLAYSVFLGWASSQIGAVCAVCISIYVGNAILLWAGLRGIAQTGTSLTANLGGLPFSNAFVTTSVVFLIAMIVGEDRYAEATKLPDVRDLSTASTPQDPAAALATLYKAPGGTVSYTGNEPLLGNADAPYLLVEFADFGCPHCARAKAELHDLVEANPDIAVRFRYFPLTGACNPVLQEGTPERCYAAFAAECAHQQGKFWQMADQLFANMPNFAPEQLAFMANEVGLDLPTWEQCMAEPSTLETVSASGQAGGEAGVQGTPAMFLQGVVPDTYVEVPRGAAAVLKLVEAHRDGLTLRPPSGR